MDNKHKYLKRFLAFVLSAAMVVTYMPTSLIAYAGDSVGSTPVAEEVNDKSSETFGQENKANEEAGTDEADIPEESQQAVSEGTQAATPETATETPSEGDKASDQATGNQNEEQGEPEPQTQNEQGETPANADEEQGESAEESGVWTVSYYVSDTASEPYETTEYEKKDGQTIGELPEAPTKTDATFTRWVIRGTDTEVTAATPVTGDMEIVAEFSDLISVTFKTEDGEIVGRYTREEGQTIGTMPQNPFKEGHTFVKWVNEKDESQEITASTEVTEDIVAIAVFEPINIYEVTLKYYYLSPKDGTKIFFGQDAYDVNEEELKTKVFEVPESTRVDKQHDDKEPVYFAENTTIVLTDADIATAEDKKITKEVQYVEYTATYSISYKLKDLDGSGYTEIEKVDDVKGVYGSNVTPAVKSYDYANLEEAVPAVINQREGQVLEVKYTRKNFALTFDTRGGSYVATQRAPYGSTLTLPGGSDAPTRAGYTFGGWYKDKECTQEAGNSIELEEDTTLYAKWNGTTVNYTVVYMKEKYDNATGTTSWVFENSRQLTGTVGTEVVATSTANAPNISLNGYERDNSGMNKTAADAKATIDADGSTVLKCYYKLIRYTLVFDINRTNGRITIGGKTYSGSNYKIENVVLGQAMGEKWPAGSSEIYSTDRYFDGWSGADRDYITKQYELVPAHVKNANSNHVMTFKATWSSEWRNSDAEYWLQQPDGSWKIADEYTQKGLHTNNLGAKDIDGYTKHNNDGSAPSGYKKTSTEKVKETVVVPEKTERRETTTYHGNTWNDGGYTWTYVDSYDWFFTTYYIYETTIPEHEETIEVEKTVYRFYYDRAKYKITYYDGGTQLKTTDPIYFEADISGATYNYTPAKPSGKEDYTWGGWYADSGLQTKYTFNKMPGNNLALYAKWIAPEYKVTFLNNYDGAQDPYAEETVSKGTIIDAPQTSPSRDNYEFIGWYADAEGETLFDFNQPITADTTVYAKWKMNDLGYTVKYLEKGTNNQLFPDKVISGPQFHVGDTITENANRISGYRPDAADKSVELKVGENTIIFYYTKNSGEITYTVKYVLDSDDSVEVHAPKSVTVDGSKVSALETAVAVDKAYMKEHGASAEQLEDTYYPLDAEQEITLTSDENQNVMVFRYANYQAAKVTVNYLDMDGNPIKSADVEHIMVGGTYVVQYTAPDGYKMHHVTEEGKDNPQPIYHIATSDPIVINYYFQKRLEITAANKAKTYDGTALTSSGVNDLVPVSGLADGHNLTAIQYDGSQTDAGSSATTPHDAVITGPESPDYYFIKYKKGTLTVNPVQVTILVEPDHYTGNVYDGTEKSAGFTNPAKKLEDYVIINNETYKKQYLNEFSYLMNKDNAALITESDAGNYTYSADNIRSKITLPTDPNYAVTLEVRDATLEISQRAIEVKAKGGSKEYDGKPITAEETGYEIVKGSNIPEGQDALAKGQKETVTLTGSQTVVGSSPAKVSNVVIKAGDKDVTNNYSIKKTDGNLQVIDRTTKYEITVKSNSATATYDGKPHKAEGFETLEFTIGGQKYIVSGLETSDPESTDATASPVKNEISGTAVVKDKDGNDVTKQFVVKKSEGTLTVNKRTVTLTSASGEKEYDGKALTKNAQTDVTVGGDGFADGEGAKYDITGSQLTAGSSANTFTYELNSNTKAANYDISTSFGTLTVTDRKTKYEITVEANSATGKYDGSEKKAEGFKTLEFEVEGQKYKVEGLTASVSKTDAGTYPNVISGTAVVKDKDGNDVTKQFAVNKTPGQLVIEKRNVTLTSASGEKEYDGKALTKNAQTDVTVGGDGFAKGEGATYDITGSQTLVGSSENTFTYKLNDGTKADNYTITTSNGTLTVKNRDAKYEIEVESNSAEAKYDGTEKKAEGFKTLEFTVNGEKYTVSGLTASVKKTDAGEYNNAISGTPVVKDAKGNDVTAQFAVSTKAGKLTIEKRKVTLTSADGEKEYDGKPLTKNEQTDVTVGGDGFAKDEGATYNITGTRTLPGEAENTFTYTLNSNTKADNYEITTKNGTLTVKDRTEKYEITVEAKSATETYDGSKKSVSGFKTLEFTVNGEKFTVSGLSASAEGTDAGTYPSEVTGTEVVKDKDGNDVTKQFTVNKTPGQLVIKPVKFPDDPDDPDDPSHDRFNVSQPEDTTYNGKEQKQPVTITDTKTKKDLTESEDYDISYTDAVDVGTVTVTIAGKGNYTGEFTRTYKINPAEVVIRTGSDSKVYDGTALTNEEASIEGLVNGETAAVSATGTQTEVGSSDNTYTIDWGDTKASNYTVTEELGTLTVTAPETADITYNLNGGTYDGSTDDIVETHNIGEVITIHEAPEREGYEFSYWKGSEYQPGDSYEVTGDHTFTAIWVAVDDDDDDIVDDDDSDDDTDDSKKDNGDGDSNKGVKTGDESDLAGWLVMMLLAGAGAGWLGFGKRRREDEE